MSNRAIVITAIAVVLFVWAIVTAAQWDAALCQRQFARARTNADSLVVVAAFKQCKRQYLWGP